MDAGAGINWSILMIGNSTTANGTMLAKLYQNFQDDPMDITLVETLGQAPVGREGRRGWTTSSITRARRAPLPLTESLALDGT